MTSPIPSAGQAALYQKLGAVTDLPDAIGSMPLLRFEDRATGFAQGAGGAGITNAVPRGALLSAAPDKPGVQNRFNFHYNPSSVSISVQWDPSMPVSFAPPKADSGGGGALILSNVPNAPTANPETLSFEILLNRIIETGEHYRGADDTLFAAYGTNVDMQLLFRTLNCFSNDDMKNILASGSTNVPPANPGYLAANQVLVYFGTDFTWRGFCSGISIVHAKFVSTMCPVLTTVQVSFIRSLAPDATSTTTGISDADKAKPADKTTGKKPTAPTFIGGATHPSQLTPGAKPLLGG